MLLLMVCGVFLVTAMAVLFGQRWLYQQAAHYRAAFKRQAHEGLSELFIFLDPVQVWHASVLCSLSLAFVLYVVTTSPVFVGLVAGLALWLPPQLLAQVRKLRIRRLESQLPDMLLGLAGALRAGLSLQAGLRQVAAHLPSPLAQEIGLLLREQRMGVSFEDALAGFYRRIPTEGSSLFVSALNIASHSGGHLAETLERMAITLRARLHLLGRIRALTSQGRMQAWIMAMLPPGLAWVLHWLEPVAMEALWRTPIGWGVMSLIALLEIAGVMMIRRIVAIRI